MRFALVACRPTHTNEALAAAGSSGVDWEPMTPEQALDELRPGDVALGRLDVLPSLDGVDDGLWVLGALAARGVTVLNDPPALLGTHDKLLTARLLRRGGVPHPRTRHIREGRPHPVPDGPVVLNRGSAAGDGTFGGVTMRPPWRRLSSSSGAPAGTAVTERSCRSS